MEIFRKDGGEFTGSFEWKDVKIFYRRKATVDKFKLDTSGTIVEGDKVQFEPWEFYKTMIRIFVTGWSGVTDGGKDVQYSYEALMDLPCDGQEDLLMELGTRIGRETGLIATPEKEKAEAELKNG